MTEQDFNHPVIGSDQTMDRANLYRDAYYRIHRFWRERVDLSLGVLFAATFAVGLTGKAVFKGENANYRPYFETFAYTSIAVGAMSLTDAIRFAREGEIGCNVATEIRINASEDLIQQQSERKFHPYGSPQGQNTVTEIQGEQLPPEPPIEDLGDTASKSKLPILLVGSTGSGKTTMLEAILYGISKSFPEAKVTFFDGKPTGGRGLLGIKQTPNYISVALPNEIPAFYAQISRYGDRLMDANRGADSGKSFVIVDELNNAIRKARSYMLAEKQKETKDQDKMNYVEALQIANDIVISQGREKNCIGIATTHEATTQALGQGSGMRSNNRFVILGSKDSFDNIESILGGTGAKLIVNPDTIARLKQQYNHHKALLFQGFFALTNVGGDWRLVRLPDYSPQFFNSLQIGFQNRVSEEGNGKDFQELTDEEYWDDESSEVPNYQDFQGNDDSGNGYAYKTSRTYASTLRIPVETPSEESQTSTSTSGKTSTQDNVRAAKFIELAESTWESWDERKKLEKVLQIGKAEKEGYSKTRIIEEILKMGGRNYAAGNLLYEKAVTMLEVLKAERSSTS